MKSFVLAIIVLFGLTAIASSSDIFDGIVNKKVERTIDLTSQFAKHTIQITISNTGSKSASAVYLAVEDSLAGHLSYLAVTDESKAELKTEKQAKAEKTSYVLYKVQLQKALEGGASAVITANYVFTHSMTPFPKAISQSDPQLVLYHDNHYFYSPYKTQSQTTTVKLASTRVENHSQLNPTSAKGDTINYGPYSDVSAFSHSDLSIHFENNKPFITVTKFVKDIEISHWGNVAVEENYDLEHSGPVLKTPFSRFDYQRNPNAARTVVTTLKEVLPAGAADVYYRDDIGNISTSHLSYREQGPYLEITPRYPLFGGWKASYYLGYNLPISQYISTDYSDSSTYVLNINFGSQTEDIAIDHLVIRVILPEGASNFQVHTPFPIDGQATGIHFTYLDTSGRPVVIIEKRNVVGEHNKNFQVTYTFSKFSMLHEPILLVGAFFTFFLFVMLYSRLEFNIGSKKQTSPNADKVDDILFRLKDLNEQRAEVHQALDQALTELHGSSTPDAYNNKRSNLNTQLASFKRDVTKLITALEDLDNETAKRLQDLEKREDAKTQAQSQVHDNEFNHKVKKSGTKDSYEKAKDNAERAYAAADEEVDNLVTDLFGNL